jgi:general secretion pathway protein L
MRSSTLTTLTLRLPSRHAAKAMPDWRNQALAFALSSREGKLLRSGAASLTELAPQIAQVQRVVLLLAASDVTLLRMPVPPMTAARLKAALPALVEDRLITDTADCVLVATPESHGMRSIAVLERSWLHSVVTTVRALGARQLVALPLQLALPLPVQGAAAAVTAMQNQIELAVRLSAYEGMGLPMVPTDAEGIVEIEVCRALLALAAQQTLALSVPAARLDAYRQAAHSLAQEGMQISVEEDNWQQLAQAADHIAFDLMAGLENTASGVVNWSRWRWPLALAAALLLLVWLWLIDPALQGRRQLQKTLPALHAQLAQLQALTKEVAALPAPSPGNPSVLSRAMLENSLTRKGIKPQTLEVNGELVRMKLSGVSFAALIVWLNEMQGAAQLAVNDATVVALEQSDRVDVSLSLRQQR